jgi:hypothetical protein
MLVFIGTGERCRTYTVNIKERPALNPGRVQKFISYFHFLPERKEAHHLPKAR